jgi:hypothetical protein
MVVALRAERRLQTDQINALFGLMMRHPGLFRCQMEMGKQPFKGEISPRERELAVLRVDWFRRAGLERA